ncbi:MAG: phage holin family protein [Armatimonadota bacterium]
MFRRWILHWIVGILSVAAAVWVAGRVGLVLEWPSPWRVVVFVPTLAIVNGLIGPVLRLFSLPITCLTFGAFGFVVNAVLFWIAGRATGAEMDFWSALLASVVVTVVGGVLSRAIGERS